MDEHDALKSVIIPSSPDKGLITPQQINQMVQSGLLLTGEAAKQQARLVTQALNQHFNRFTEESTSLGSLTLASPDDTVEAYRKITTQHGQILMTALFPLSEVDPLHNQFISEFLRETFKLWAFSPVHRSKAVDISGTPSKYFQRFYHLIRTAPGYCCLLQRDAVSEESSSPHAHWSIEAYTPILGVTKLLIGADNKQVDLKSGGTFIAVPGQVHAVANPKGVISLTYLEIIGDPTPIKMSPQNKSLLNPTGVFPKSVWIQLAKAQGIIK